MKRLKRVLVLVTLTSLVSTIPGGAGWSASLGAAPSISEAGQLLSRITSREDVLFAMALGGATSESLRAFNVEMKKRSPRTSLLPRFKVVKDEIVVDGKATGFRIKGTRPFQLQRGAKTWTYDPKQLPEENLAALEKAFASKTTAMSLFFPSAEAQFSAGLSASGPGLFAPIVAGLAFMVSRAGSWLPNLFSFFGSRSASASTPSAASAPAGAAASVPAAAPATSGVGAAASVEATPQTPARSLIARIMNSPTAVVSCSANAGVVVSANDDASRSVFSIQPQFAPNIPHPRAITIRDENRTEVPSAQLSAEDRAAIEGLKNCRTEDEARVVQARFREAGAVVASATAQATAPTRTDSAAPSNTVPQ